ncbi:MAG: hypothetical protein EXR07_12305 [Acetobacteraceae bacterium]|nr:hypothetical protein [Acetobacteraceae bacterium]
MLRHLRASAHDMGLAMHRFGVFCLTLLVLLSLLCAAAAWRLSQGPVVLSFLKDSIEEALNKSIAPIRISLGTASIAWQGFSHGVDQPLILRVTDLTIEQTEGTAHVRVPIVEASLSARGLVMGRVLPREIVLDGARLTMIRQADGSVSLNLGGTSETDRPSPLTGLLRVLGTPAGSDLQAGGAQFSQISKISIRGAALLLDDRRFGVTWSAPRGDMELSRRAGGGVDGRAVVSLAFGDRLVDLEAKFNLTPEAKSAHVQVHLSKIDPKALAKAIPELDMLAALDAPVVLEGEADLGPDLNLSRARVTARMGAGNVNTGTGTIPFRGAELIVSGTPENLVLERGTIELQPKPGAPLTNVSVSGRVTHAEGRRSARLHLTLDRVAFADLPLLWPADIAPHAQAWITQNILAGTARDGTADLVLEKPDDAPDIALVQATAALEGEGLTVTWLPTVPPVEQGRARLVVTDPDKLEIDVKSGRQAVRGGDPIALRGGHVTITGLSKTKQVASIRCDVAGSVPSAIALLKEPRLRIFDRYPMDLKSPTGDARLSIQAVIPLELNLRFDDVAIRGAGSLNKVHLTGIAAGRDLDDGAVVLDVDTNRLTLKGTARLAGIPVTIDGMMDFRAGPQSQMTQRYALAGKTTATALAEIGLNTGGLVTGDVGLNAIVSEFRSGDGEVNVEADLTAAVLFVPPMNWRKPAGGAAKASARIKLFKDKLVGIDAIAIDGPDLRLRGGATVSDGRVEAVRVDRANLGRTDVGGTIRLPRNGPIGIDLSGPSVDASAKLLEKPSPRDRGAPGLAWSLRGRFDRVLLAHEQSVHQIVVSADFDGAIYRGLSVGGKTAAGEPLSMRIAGDRGARRVSVETADAGGLLRGLDITSTIQDGTLTVAGTFDDSTADHALSGTFEMNDFRVNQAPALGRLLQAVTLYGLVDALGGPGLSFARLIAPFQLTGDTLSLRDARAFSPSLGLTAKGRIDRASERLDLEGTIVPAYIFNSMLGRLPLIGKLFTAEKDGGLIAMNYSLRGPMDNPSVMANPLSAVTPGFLRGMFGLFDQAPSGTGNPGGDGQKP